MNNKTSNTYKMIDVFKLICAMLVLLLHCIETSDFTANSIKFIFTRLAVPYFFIVSGFFLYKGLENCYDKKMYFRKYLKNIIKLFVIWALIIYAPFVIYSYIKANSGRGVLYITLVLIRRIFIIGPGHFWYLLALGISASVIFWFNYNNKDKLLYCIAILGMFLLICYSSFYEILSNYIFFELIFKIIYYVFSWEYNFLMFGLPFMVIGYYIAKNNVRINIKLCLTVFILATLGRYIEYYIPTWTNLEILKRNQLNVFYIIQSITLFLVTIKCDLNITESTSLLIRKLSSFIYFSHSIILYNILNPVLDNFTNLDTYSVELIFPKFILVMLICVLLFVSIIKSNNKYLNNLLK